MTEQVTVFHVNGESYTVYPVDARVACERHSEEYRMEPWSEEQRHAHSVKVAKARQASTAARRERDADAANGTLVVRGPASA